ncbi:MAG: hypothetical protein M1830_010462 [Pleopsidium flavum]|nr:MAG: hypothetical protein M1830_010462 [Pleopsidium flavum]
MPGRVSTRTSTASGLARKSSAQTLNSRASTVSRISSPATFNPDEGPSSQLRTRICAIFSDAQRTTAGHRKLVINLRKIQEACCYEPTKPGKVEEDFGEDDFNVEVARCVIRLMAVRKSEAVGDRIVRFLGLFLRHASEKDISLAPVVESDETHSFPETPSTRLTSHILSILLPLLVSKEKAVRYRSTQLMSHIINSLDSVDDEYYHLLRTGLLKRIRDKESMVRVQAILGLGRLAGNEADENLENEDSDDDDCGGLLEKLLEVLQNDPSADVRRSLLLNLPLTPSTLPYLLERARDVDPATRRALYSRLLPALGDFRHLSLSMREKLLRWGLRDRDENVRKAAGRLFRERWIEDCAGTRVATEAPPAGEAVPPSIDGLLELLERIDVVNSGVETGVGLEAMREFWDGRPDYRDAVAFDDAFWDGLSAERVFMARSFNDFCRTGKVGQYEALVEEKMPEVTKLAFFLQRWINNLIENIRKAAEAAEGEEVDVTIEQEFIVEQLLHIAQTLDYSDEVGRRKMFALLRESLAIPELPEEVTKLVVEVLRCVCGGEAAREREFCGIVLEAVAEVHDTIAGDEPLEEPEDESFHSARSELSGSTPAKSSKSKGGEGGGGGGDGDGDGEDKDEDEEKAIREIMINLKCLHIAQCMLQNIEGNLQQNVHLVTMLNNLVVPAVRSHEAPIRERGLLCLGLCCLLDKTLAEENLTLFLHCFNKGHDALQNTSIHILSDILTTHPTLLASPAASTSADDPAAVAAAAAQKAVFKIFSKALKAYPTPDVQSAGTTALCKLMLGSIIKDEDLLKALVISYFEPSTAENAAVRQSLSYFLPVYCHSRRENMERMGKVGVAIVHALMGVMDELDEEEEMVGMSVVGAHVIDWTDARKLVVQDTGRLSWDEMGRKEVKAVNADIHLDLGVDILEKILSSGCPKEEKKILISMLGKLYISPTSTADKLHTVHDLVNEAIEARIASDAPSRNALNKLHTALTKAIGSSTNGVAATAKSGDDGDDGMTIVEDGLTVVEEEDEKGDVGEKMEGVEDAGEEAEGAKDSILEELLGDEAEEEEL